MHSKGVLWRTCAESVAFHRFSPAGWEGECKPGRRSHTLLADPRCATKDQREAHEEARAPTGRSRGGGHCASHTKDLQVEEGGQGSITLGGPDAADADAFEPGPKRSRASASRYDSSTES